MTDEIIILVGASAYPLTTRNARWLTDRLRESYADTDDPHRRGAVALAWALELTLEGGEQEPLEFGLPQVEPVLDVMETAPLSPGLLRLQQALRRLRGNDG